MNALAMREAEVTALRASHQGKFDHAAFEAHQAKLRAAFDAQPRKVRISDIHTEQENV